MVSSRDATEFSSAGLSSDLARGLSARLSLARAHADNNNSSKKFFAATLDSNWNLGRVWLLDLCTQNFNYVNSAAGKDKGAEARKRSAILMTEQT